MARPTWNWKVFVAASYGDPQNLIWYASCQDQASAERIGMYLPAAFIEDPTGTQYVSPILLLNVSEQTSRYHAYILSWVEATIPQTRMHYGATLKVHLLEATKRTICGKGEPFEWHMEDAYWSKKESEVTCPACLAELSSRRPQPAAATLIATTPDSPRESGAVFLY